MITEPAASFVAARADVHTLVRIGLASTTWSTKNLAGILTEYAASGDPAARFEVGVREAVVHCYVTGDTHLTAELAPEVLHAARPRRDGPCHYVLQADGYSADFAEAFQNLAGDAATVTLVDCSIMEQWNEDRAALGRLTIAEHALNDDPPSHLFLYETGEPDDAEAVSEQFGRVITRICDMVMHYHGDIDVAEGVKRSWQILAEHDYSVEDQRVAALVGIGIAIGAIEALFPTIGIDNAVRNRPLRALLEAIAVLDPGDPEEE